MLIFYEFLYNFSFSVMSLGMFPHFLVRLKQSKDPGRMWRERCGNFSEAFKLKARSHDWIWIHAVSVGEVMAVREFIEKLCIRFPHFKVLLTTVTPTGQKIAKSMENHQITVCYFPFDMTRSVRRFFNIFRPHFLLLAETEIWPNLILEAHRENVPVGIINARLSEKSLKRYQRFAGLFKPVFKRIAFVLAQEEKDKQRFLKLGLPFEKTIALGNMKYDNVKLETLLSHRVAALKQEWGFQSEDFILVAGSTHNGEEKMLLETFQQLQPQYQSLKIMIAPRHIERSHQIGALAQRFGLKALYASERDRKQDFDVLILDQIGVLKHLYAIADVVFVGGSLIRRGGQNPIEPASFKRPILHGPHVMNFEKVYRVLHEECGALEVKDQVQLAFALNRLLQDSDERRDLGERAFQSIQRLQGATDRHLDRLLEWLSPALAERKQDVEVHTNLLSKVSGGV